MPEKRSTTIRLDEDGDVQPDSSALVKWLADQFSLFADGRAVVTVERPKRTLGQNRLIWGLLYPAIHDGLREAGVTELHLMGDDGEALTLPITVDTIHKIMKHKYLTPSEPGKEPSTRNLSTTEFSRYVENVRFDDWVQRHEIEIPMPDQPPVDAYEEEQT